MFVHPGFDPVAIQLGPVAIHWYGLSYLAAFYLGWWIAVRRSRLAHVDWKRDEIGDLLFYVVLGIILGGRAGYVLIYNFDGFIADPLSLIRVWQGGMSFHGGLVGVILCLFWFARKTGRNFFDVTDFMVVPAPVGLLCGRIGNFINAELWGRTTDAPWGMVFPTVGPEPRHASQLYEAVLEGALLLALMLWFSARPRPRMAVSGLFLAGYGVARTTAEFFREPDHHMGFIVGDWLTTGQLLSLPMIVAGATLLILSARRNGGKS